MFVQFSQLFPCLRYIHSFICDIAYLLRDPYINISSLYLFANPVSVSVPESYCRSRPPIYSNVVKAKTILSQKSTKFVATIILTWLYTLLYMKKPEKVIEQAKVYQEYYLNWNLFKSVLTNRLFKKMIVPQIRYRFSCY